MTWKHEGWRKHARFPDIMTKLSMADDRGSGLFA